MGNAREAGPHRWRARPMVAATLRAGIFVLPLVLSLAATALLRIVLPRPHGGAGWTLWWCGLLTVGVAVAVGTERVGRRLLPLVMLLKLSMLFPDRAPSRVAVARQAGSVRKLAERLRQIEDDPSARDEATSAAGILALISALQSHDRRTRGHSERVRVFADLLAEELHLRPEDRYRLRWAALLHDVGKLTVQAGILNKPGKLDEDEWSAIRHHPLEGARIAAPLLEWLGPWGQAIAEHHERFDGAGYPAGLAAEEISLAGRIVAVADAYDTMTAARSYKKPMAVRTAREELARCAGSQFDPVAVRAFFAISLPRLLRRTGPAAFLAQLPFLASLQAIGQQAVTAAVQGAAAVTVVAGIGSVVVTPAAPGSATPAGAVTPRPPAATSTVLGTPDFGTQPGPLGGSEPGARPTTTVGPTGGPSLAPEPSAEPSPSPSPSPSASPSGGPLPSIDPLPTSPLPLPSIPLPSVSIDPSSILP